MGVLLSIHNQKVHTLIAEYERETGVNLPYCGRVHDIGPAVSHKAQIVELMVKGYAAPIVADKMNHSISSRDRYIKDSKWVTKLG